MVLPVTTTDGNEEKDLLRHRPRPTSLHLIPKSQLQPQEKYESIATKNKSGVMFSSRSVTLGGKKTVPGKPAVKNTTSSPRGPPMRRKLARGSSQLRKYTESSFDADDEDATQSPLLSHYSMSSRPVHQTDDDHSPLLEAKGGPERMTVVAEVLKMKAMAEVHQQTRFPPLKESRSQESTTSPADSSHATSLVDFASVTSPASLSASSSPKRRRPRLQRSETIDTDEVTGQQREDVPTTNALPELQTTATLPLETAKRLYKTCLKESSLFVPPLHNSDDEGDELDDDNV